MRYLTIHPDYFRWEAFGTLMGHYSVMYCLYKDTGIIPTILDIDWKSYNITSAMQFFNQFDEPVLSHVDVFDNLSKLFKVVNHNDINTFNWLETNYKTKSYQDLVQYIMSNDRNILFFWDLSQQLYNHVHNDEIINVLFQFNNIIINRSKNLLPNVSKTRVAVCVRNEYRKLNSAHTKLSTNYYRESMKYFDSDSQFLIFSDSKKESQEFLLPLESEFNIQYMDDLPSAIGMCAMSLCDHIIGANSSFSYWASKLNKNPNKKILCPTKFINEHGTYLANLLNYKWYPSDWIGIDVI